MRDATPDVVGANAERRDGRRKVFANALQRALAAPAAIAEYQQGFSGYGSLLETHIGLSKGIGRVGGERLRVTAGTELHVELPAPAGDPDRRTD